MGGSLSESLAVCAKKSLIASNCGNGKGSSARRQPSAVRYHDHFARPVLIGGTTRLPFVWVLLGILGGVESFGLLGLFLGPALLAVLITLWRELADG